jgi:hypothetical protein
MIKQDDADIAATLKWYFDDSEPDPRQIAAAALEALIAARGVEMYVSFWPSWYDHADRDQRCVVGTEYHTGFRTGEEALLYLTDRDAFGAKHFGCRDAQEYREWTRANGLPLCSVVLGDGTRCPRQVANRGRLEPAEWRESHRNGRCSQHKNRK